MPGVQVVKVADLKLWVWRNVGIRRHLVGRQVIDDFTELAVQHWEGEAFTHAVDPDQREIVKQQVISSVKRGYQVVSGKEVEEYGIFWTLVLQAIASIVVQLILEWWLDRRMNRVRILVWQQELLR
jgi:hypothetical protein